MPPRNPGYTYHRLVVGYHGCDRAVGEQVLLQGEHLKESNNRWDWLGKGIYFWEHGRRRAWQFAEWKRDRGEIAEPFVVGAYIHLGRCFDLTDTWATEQLRPYHAKLVETLEQRGEPLPRNKKAGPKDFDLVLRDLDCAVLNFCLAALDRTEGGGDVFYQTVRGVFIEGEPVYPDAQIYEKTHVQLAVRDSSCILGYFRPAE